MMKSKYFLFIFILCLLLISCPQDPNKGKGTSAEARDENGHLEKIEYFNNGTLYKTEYYEYLNKHDEESRLVKTVENGQTTYEMEECWKVAYALQKNVYKCGGVFAIISPNRREYLSEIKSNKTITYTDGLNRKFEYDIESFTAKGEYTFRLIYDFSISGYDIIVIGDGNDGNRHYYVLAED